VKNPQVRNPQVKNLSSLCLQVQLLCRYIGVQCNTGSDPPYVHDVVLATSTRYTVEFYYNKVTQKARVWQSTVANLTCDDAAKTIASAYSLSFLDSNTIEYVFKCPDGCTGSIWGTGTYTHVSTCMHECPAWSPRAFLPSRV
jgi:hypothetical protein